MDLLKYPYDYVNYGRLKISTLTVAELKEKLKDRNLSMVGTKAKLLKWLLDAGLSPEELGTAGQNPGEMYGKRHDEAQPGPSAQTITLNFYGKNEI